MNRMFRITLPLTLAAAGFGAGTMFAVAQEPTPPAPTESTATTSPATDPCLLVTQAEAERALGAPVSGSVSSGQCTYVSLAADGRTVGVASPSGLPGAEHLRQAMEQVSGALGGQLHTVTGVGDEAYAITSNLVAQLMTVRNGTYVVVVMTAPTGTASEQVQTLTELGQVAIDRA